MNQNLKKAGIVPREVWLEAAQLGMLGPTVPEEYGGLGLDRRYSVIAIEEQARALLAGPSFNGHSNMCAPYLMDFCTEEQKQRFLPGTVNGECLLALAMTEPDTGSDLKAIRTTAVRDGDDYIINGRKIFITNGISADLVIVACKTDTKAGAKGISMILVEADRPGFVKAKKLEKLGIRTQDTAELVFDNVRVPASNLLGEEGGGFGIMMRELAWERLQIGIWAVANCEGMLDETIQYTKDRKAFGQAIAGFQNTRFKLADLASQVQLLYFSIERATDLMLEGKLDAQTAAMIKLTSSELMGKVADECVQLHGGNGYMWEYPITRAYADARIQRIWGGTSEIMKEIVARKIMAYV